MQCSPGSSPGSPWCWRRASHIYCSVCGTRTWCCCRRKRVTDQDRPHHHHPNPLPPLLPTKPPIAAGDAGGGGDDDADGDGTCCCAYPCQCPGRMAAAAADADAAPHAAWGRANCATRRWRFCCTAPAMQMGSLNSLFKFHCGTRGDFMQKASQFLSNFSEEIEKWSR